MPSKEWYEAYGIQKPFYADDAVCIVHADCRDILPLIPDKSIDLVLTDPPYPQEYIECFSIVSLYAQSVLKVGSPLLCYSGQLHLPEVIERLSEHLSYRWTIALLHKQSQIVWGARMIAAWKPILLFQNGIPDNPLPIHRDVIDPSGRVKELHEWQQNDKDIGSLILDYSIGNGIILDPFLGSGTTAWCAKKLGRKAIGIEIELKYCRIAAERCQQAVLPLEVEQVQQGQGDRQPLMFNGMASTAKSDKITGKMSIGEIAKETDR